MLTVDFSNAPVQVEEYAQGLAQANTWLQEATGKGNDFVGPHQGCCQEDPV